MRFLDRLNRLKAILRRAFGPPYRSERAEEADAVAERKDLPEVEQATEELRQSARHLKTVSRRIAEETDPDRPGSFEHSMRQLLGRLH